jgi:DNA polymerase-3 subunit epsilon
VLCTVKLSRRLFPQHRRHNLDALLVRHALFCLDRHRALGDARVLWELAQAWRQTLGEESLNSVCAALLARPIVPPGLPADVFDALPETPGVYLFFDADNRLLFVGSSGNIRSRVIGHFSGERRMGKDIQIAAEVSRVDCIETAGELSAHLKRARLLEELAPVYNRPVRSHEALYAWHWRSGDPATAPRLVDASDTGRDDVDDTYGLFATRASATKALRELASAYELCHVVLGLEARSGDRACAAFSGGGCRGACVERESAIAHSMRLVQALSRLRLKPWPYAGPIALRERDPHSGRTEVHVVDAWRHLATLDSEADFDPIAHTDRPARFDGNAYRILVRYLRSPPRNCDVLQLKRSRSGAAVADDHAGPA